MQPYIALCSASVYHAAAGELLLSCNHHTFVISSSHLAQQLKLLLFCHDKDMCAHITIGTLYSSYTSEVECIHVNTLYQHFGKNLRTEVKCFKWNIITKDYRVQKTKLSFQPSAFMSESSMRSYICIKVLILRSQVNTPALKCLYWYCKSTHLH